MHEYDYRVPPSALWEWDDGMSTFPPNLPPPVELYRGADSAVRIDLTEENPGEGELKLYIRKRGEHRAIELPLSGAQCEVTVPADVTRDMEEGMEKYIYDIMLVGEDNRTVLRGPGKVIVYQTAGGVQYNRRAVSNNG